MCIIYNLIYKYSSIFNVIKDILEVFNIQINIYLPQMSKQSKRSKKICTNSIIKYKSHKIL